LSQLKLIAEPWDPGPGGYQLGNHPPPFAEWNDRYRDTVRRYWRGDSGIRPELARRLSGSADIFRRPIRPSWASVNFLASHDGMTLADVASYDRKHNQANGEDNRDGAEDDCSANWGAEGPADDPAVNELRQRVIQSMLVTLFMSQGTPMLTAGDEFGRSQSGNNNAYCQDNEISWVNWATADSDFGTRLMSLASRAIAVRKTFSFLLTPDRLNSGQLPDNWSAVDWLDERNMRLSESDWENREGRALVLRYAGMRADGKIEILALLMNASNIDLDFKLPDAPRWVLVFDTAKDAAMFELEDSTYRVANRAAVLINAVADPELLPEDL
jgi:glycogen operon protein